MVALEAMEKRRSTYDLNEIKTTLGSVESLAMTTSALRDAAALGFDRYAIVETIGGIDKRMFFQSMTTFADHRVWQDVHHEPVGTICSTSSFKPMLLRSSG